MISAARMLAVFGLALGAVSCHAMVETIEDIAKVSGRSVDEIERLLPAARAAPKTAADRAVVQLAHERNLSEEAIKTATCEVMKDYAAKDQIPDDPTIAGAVAKKLLQGDRFTADDSRKILDQARSAAARDRLPFYAFVVVWCLPHG